MSSRHVPASQIGPNGTWFGLIDGDSIKDEMHYLFTLDGEFVRFKRRLLKVDVMQVLTQGHFKTDFSPPWINCSVVPSSKLASLYGLVINFSPAFLCQQSQM